MIPTNGLNFFLNLSADWRKLGSVKVVKLLIQIGFEEGNRIGVTNVTGVDFFTHFECVVSLYSNCIWTEFIIDQYPFPLLEIPHISGKTGFFSLLVYQIFNMQVC